MVIIYFNRKNLKTQQHLIFGILIVLTACQSKVVAPVKHMPSFDFKAFFDSEIALLKANQVALTKTIVDKENVYSNEDKKPNWDNELLAFKNFAYIKPQQLDQYEVDTLNSENGLVFITYSANNANLHLQLAEVMYNQNKTVEKITLVVKSQSKISTNDITLTYLPQKGYDIKGDVNSSVAGNHLIDIHVSCN